LRIDIIAVFILYFYYSVFDAVHGFLSRFNGGI